MGFDWPKRAIFKYRQRIRLRKKIQHSMHLPVVVWSNSSLKALGLTFTTSTITAPHDATSIVMVCGTEQGALLLFRSVASTWQLDCLMLRHTASIVGLATAVNEWGEFVCLSLDVQGSVGVWLLRDGRSMEWKSDVVSELAPLLGLQTFCNQRYALAYGEQGRMLVVDAWTCSTLACLGTGFEQVRRDVGVGECAHSKDKSHQIDSKIIVLGTEGLCKLYNWAQPISTSMTPSSHELLNGPANAPVHATTTTAAVSSVSYLWQEESSWIVSWATDTLDMSCIHTQINPQTTFVQRSHFPIRVILSPNASLVLLLWQSKFAVFHRSWLEHDSRHHPVTRPSVCVGDNVTFVDGCFTDNVTILLWTNHNAFYSFPAVVADNVTAQVGQVFVFQPIEDMEVPQSVAFQLARVDLPAAPIFVIPDACVCPQGSLLSSRTGHVATVTTEHRDLLVSYVRSCGCSLLHNTTVTSSSSPICFVPLPASNGDDNGDDKLTVSHAILDHGSSSDSPVSAPILIHGYSDGQLRLHALGGRHASMSSTSASSMALSLPKDIPASRIVALAHLTISRMSKASTALYESYADSPTHGLGFQAANLTKISTLLHKLHQHSLTPRAATPTHSSAHHSTPAIPPAAPMTVPLHLPAPTVPTASAAPPRDRVCLVFAGTSTGHLVVSQVRPSASSWIILTSFHRHSRPINGIYVSSGSRNSILVASVGDDRKMTVYAVHNPNNNSSSNSNQIGELSVDVLVECVGHGDDIVGVDWAFQTNHVIVKCADHLLYIWSLTTGILERIVPQAMVLGKLPLLRPTSAMSNHHHLPNVHVFPCDVESFDGLLTNDYVTALLAYLLTWHDNVHLDQLVQESLGIREPTLPYSIAIVGHDDAITVPLPRKKQPHATKCGIL